MQQKKGQLTLFILIGIVVVLVIVAVGYFIGRSSAVTVNEAYFKDGAARDSLSLLQDDFLNCRDDVTLDSLQTIGVQGGYFEKPPQADDLGWVFFPYYYSEGELLMPQRSVIEQQLGKAVDEGFVDCVAEIDSAFTLEYDVPQSSAKILDDEVYFEIDMPITITEDANSIILEMKDFEKVYNFSLSNILDVAEYYTNSHTQDPEMYCITCLSALAEEKDVYVDIVPYEENTMMVVITNNNSFIDPYAFVFLNKYTGNEASPDITSDEVAPDAPSVV